MNYYCHELNGIAAQDANLLQRKILFEKYKPKQLNKQKRKIKPR
jgi:hypothetical protein